MFDWHYLAPFEKQVEKKEGRGRGHWGHEGRPGKVGGSKPGKGKVGAKPKSRAEAAEARRKRGAEKRKPPEKKGTEYTQARADKKIGKVLANAFTRRTFTPENAKYVRYRKTKNTISIEDIGGELGHIAFTLDKDNLSWDKLTVDQVAAFLDRHGASKKKPARRKRRRRSYVHYD